MSPMPDDRPVSPEERLREKIVAALRAEADRAPGGIMDTLRAPDRWRSFRLAAEFVEQVPVAALSTPAGPSPEPGRLARQVERASENVRNSPYYEPREEAVEAAARAIRRERVHGGQAGTFYGQEPSHRDYDFARVALNAARHAEDRALSAARPSSPPTGIENGVAYDASCVECGQRVEHRNGAWICPTHFDRGHVHFEARPSSPTPEETR